MRENLNPYRIAQSLLGANGPRCLGRPSCDGWKKRCP